MTDEQPTIMQGLNRMALIEDLELLLDGYRAGEIFGGNLAEEWLIEQGFLTPGPEDDDD